MGRCAGCLVLLISISLYQTVFTLRRLINEFKNVDSDFDLEKSIANFKVEDYANMTQEFDRAVELGPKSGKGYNVSSAEITKLLNTGQHLLETSAEKKLQSLRNSILEKELEAMRLKNSTNTTDDKPDEKKRVKRSQFTEASKVDNLKMLRIYMIMFKNLFAVEPIGGRHPLDKDVPEPICILFKHRIYKWLYPPVGDEKKVA